MHIDQYKQPDGWFKYPPEAPIDFESAVDVLGHMVGFCGCGRPEDALRFMAGKMRLIHNIQATDWSDAAHMALHNSFHDYGERYFFYYMLDHFGLTEHGSSVPGWLTQKGIEFMEDVEALPVEAEAKLEKS